MPNSLFLLLLLTYCCCCRAVDILLSFTVDLLSCSELLPQLLTDTSLFPSAVMSLRFPNDDKTQLVSCSKDGTISVFSLLSDPPSLLHTLRGHTSSVNDFDWSVANDFIVSASSDGTCRLWESATGKCVREIPDSASKVLCCRFHPQNNNLLVVS